MSMPLSWIRPGRKAKGAQLDRTGSATYLAVKAGNRFVDSTPAPRCKLHHLYTKSLCSDSFNFRSS